MSETEKTVEERLSTIETNMESLNTVLHQFVQKINELRQNSTEVSSYVAAMMRTVMDGRPMTRESLTESSVQNQVDKLNGQLQNAVTSGILAPSTTDTVENDSVIVAQQFNGSRQEINRRVVLSVAEMPAADKALYVGKTVGEEVVGSLEVADSIILIHEVYNPAKKVEVTA